MEAMSSDSDVEALRPKTPTELNAFYWNIRNSSEELRRARTAASVLEVTHFSSMQLAQ